MRIFCQIWKKAVETIFSWLPKKNPNPKVLSSSDARIEGQIQIEDAVVIDPSQTGSGLPVVVSADGNAIQVNGSEVPVLDEEGKLELGVLPYVGPGLINVFTVASEAAQLALEAQEGDVAVRTDLENAAFMHNGGDEGTVADWTQISFIHVTSVAGKTGDVTLQTADITDLDTSAFAAASHTHEAADITDFDPADKADANHNHAIADVTGLQDALDSAGGGGGGGVALPITVNDVTDLVNAFGELKAALSSVGHVWTDPVSAGGGDFGFWSQEAIYKMTDGALEPLHSYDNDPSVSGKYVVASGWLDNTYEIGYIVYYSSSPNPTFEIARIDGNGVNPSSETVVTTNDPATDMPLSITDNDGVPFDGTQNFSLAASADTETLYIKVWVDENLGSNNWERTYVIYGVDLGTGSSTELVSTAALAFTGNSYQYDAEGLAARRVISGTEISCYVNTTGETNVDKLVYNAGSQVYEYNVATDSTTSIFTLPDPDENGIGEEWSSSLGLTGSLAAEFAIVTPIYQLVTETHVSESTVESQKTVRFGPTLSSPTGEWVWTNQTFLLDQDNIAYSFAWDIPLAINSFVRPAAIDGGETTVYVFFNTLSSPPGTETARLNIGDSYADTSLWLGLERFWIVGRIQDIAE